MAAFKMALKVDDTAGFLTTELTYPDSELQECCGIG